MSCLTVALALGIYAMKKFLIPILLSAAIVLIAITITFRAAPTLTPDAVLINDAVMTFSNNPHTADSISQFNAQLSYALQDMDRVRMVRDSRLRATLYTFVILVAAASFLLCFYCDRKILAPFRKLKKFARRIAAGNLDTPLEMDSNNLFGAFTESFDIMREELHHSRESERSANQSKKELVASLSHDIKTPVASIKAVTELMLVLSTNEKEKSRLHTITSKAEQIDALITNMFHATLEELEALSVTQEEVASTQISAIIKSADYNMRVTDFTIPDCLLLADALRLQQVFDNIISNSYKYAVTDICISSFYDAEFLSIEIRDFGTGVPEEDLPLVTGKFYRGSNAHGAEGHGIGLYISRYFMQQMGGELECKNVPGGFVVRVSVRLAR